MLGNGIAQGHPIALRHHPTSVTVLRVGLLPYVNNRGYFLYFHPAVTIWLAFV